MRTHDDDSSHYRFCFSLSQRISDRKPRPARSSQDTRQEIGMRHSHKVAQYLYQKREGLGFLSLASMTQPPENTGTTLAGGLRI
ncbi:hypothetical protein L905_10405 [Agrobacterium sp. TS43]|nr:hypothetical protein K538_28445 [Agrobacterium tumefaciens GW4]KVK40058.1 hypothetical protein L904_15440 [Agrobacterium sp. LY4]KVK51484.1 hypothetical protein L903_16525 [Agrobacterium sp. JL28]KVK53784.1 hypothetical protein L901_03455 [Agrobacterium sp. D14]KVK63680.1 hypothetical protein L906_16475 [Agrobacterium sp. TS45]KVK68108.1 hypothetical protein L907_16435 [Agrobacterium sp. C13]KVK70712.1 hypothetical protein L905_10405 [Agrobacterium sp. TS43]OCJ63968.1 hypothetical protein